MFLHKIMLEILVLWSPPVKCEEFIDAYAELTKEDDVTHKTKLLLQFEVCYLSYLIVNVENYFCHVIDVRRCFGLLTRLPNLWPKWLNVFRFLGEKKCNVDTLSSRKTKICNKSN
jgi:hypothetical protein